jgi:GTP cyclohydrolase IA
MSREDATRHARAMLDALGLTPATDPELALTPERFVELLSEFRTAQQAPAPKLSTFAHDGHADPVLLCALPFQSLCVHHLLPFFGTIDVAYIPGEQIVGFGSIGRVIEHFARRPQMQERMVQQIADLLQAQLNPAGLLVRCRARQLCMELRGARKRGALLSFASRGVLIEGAQRAEALRAFEAAEIEP